MAYVEARRTPELLDDVRRAESLRVASFFITLEATGTDYGVEGSDHYEPVDQNVWKAVEEYRDSTGASPDDIWAAISVRLPEELRG